MEGFTELQLQDKEILIKLPKFTSMIKEFGVSNQKVGFYGKPDKVPGDRPT